MSGWKLTATSAIMWWIASAINAALGDWEEAVVFFFAGAGWAGWASEERKNTPNAKLRGATDD